MMRLLSGITKSLSLLLIAVIVVLLVNFFSDLLAKRKNLEIAAINFKNMAMKCTDDVRNNNIRYEKSANCQSLGDLDLKYQKLRFKDGNRFGDFAKSDAAELNYAYGDIYAWMARAPKDARLW